MPGKGAPIQLPPPELLDFIKGGQRFLIVGHHEPDGDCIGSQMALASVLRRLGKECILLNHGPWNKPEIKQYQKHFESAPPPLDGKDTRLLITDCTGIDRTGDDLAAALKNFPAAIIDHHLTNTSTDGIRYVCPASPSTCILILYIIEALDLEVTGEEAQCLFLGLSTDTGFFRHLETGTGQVFRAAAALSDAGASPKAIFAAINGGKTLGSRMLLGRMLERAESYFDGRLLYTWEELDDRASLGEDSRDSDMLYQLLQSVAGVEAIFVVRQDKPDKCSIGLRSLNQIDVSRIASSLGGGGHKNAAGVYLDGVIADIKPLVLAKFAEAFE
jgi:phosphoesterase RecJ-like protein